MKPAGLDEGPVIPVAEKTMETGSPEALVDLLCDAVRTETNHSLHKVLDLKTHAARGVDEAREYVKAMLGLQVYAHSLYQKIKARDHEDHHSHS